MNWIFVVLVVLLVVFQMTRVHQAKKCPLLSISNQHGVLHKYLQLWNCVKIAALLRDANQVDKSLLSTVTVFSSNFAFVYISNVILISLSRQENLSKDMNESNNELVLDELFYDLLIYVSQRWKILFISPCFLSIILIHFAGTFH